MLTTIGNKNRTDLKTEIIAGTTAFFAISYIIMVNPLIMADAGVPIQLGVFATIFVSIIGCLMAGTWADAPIVLAPGMGVNAFFSYTVVLNMGFSWRAALGISLTSGVIFTIIACTPLAEIIAEAVPQSLKHAITAGIGMFLVEIGLEKGELIETGKNSIIQLASLQNPAAILTLLGLILSIILYLRKVRGNFFIAIAVVSIVGTVMGIGAAAPISVSLNDLWSYKNIVWQMDFTNIFSLRFWLAVFSMTMILIFDTIGILEGILPDKKNFGRAFSVSSIAVVFSSMLGSCPTVVAAESAAGIASGGRNGKMAVTAGMLFIAALFFTPFLGYIPPSAIAPVIIITGTMMMCQLQYVKFNDFTEWFPVLLLVMMITFSGSISTGMAFGFIMYPLMKAFAGKARQVHPLVYALGFLFLVDLFSDFQ